MLESTWKIRISSEMYYDQFKSNYKDPTRRNHEFQRRVKCLFSIFFALKNSKSSNCFYQWYKFFWENFVISGMVKFSQNIQLKEETDYCQFRSLIRDA